MSADWYPGIKAFCAYWGYAPMLQQTLHTMEREFDEENDACIDAAKCMVECASQLLIQTLDDPRNPIQSWPDSPIKGQSPSTQNWVTAAVRLLQLSDDRHDRFNKVISRHYDLAASLAKFRDCAGTVSHGKRGFSDKLSIHHQRAALLAADAIVTFLHEAYLEREPDPIITFEPYDRFRASNELIDRHATIRAEADEDGVLQALVLLPTGDEVPLTVTPSQLLFGVDREAYKLALSACKEANGSVQAEAQDQEAD